MAAKLENFIGGKSVPATGDGTHEVRNAATGEVIAEMGNSSAADVDAAVAAASKAFAEWKEATPAERSLALLNIAAELEERGEELAKIESENTGKPLQLTIEEEIPPAVDQIRFFAGAARMLEGLATAEAAALPDAAKARISAPLRTWDEASVATIRSMQSEVRTLEAEQQKIFESATVTEDTT